LATWRPSRWPRLRLPTRAVALVEDGLMLQHNIAVGDEIRVGSYLPHCRPFERYLRKRHGGLGARFTSPKNI
jgi:hypothetical protein